LVSFKNATFLTNKYNYLTTTNAQSDFLQKNIITLGPQMPKKDRQYNGKKDRQYNGKKKDRQYNGKKKDRQYNRVTSYKKI
jgi:hypothetical protein